MLLCYWCKGLDRCEKCGKCCSNLRVGDKKTGLTLFPDEIHLFPEQTLKPHMAKGADAPTTIFTYQHTENLCIHLEDNLCNIYEKRPLMCRSFPVKLGPSGLRFSPGCKAVLNILKNSNTINGDKPEIKAALEIAERLYDFHNSFEGNEIKWNYNLIIDSWEKI